MRPHVLLLAPLLIAAGPIAKFEEKPPADEYVTNRALGDVERCLINMDGMLVPRVFRQPDRPDESMVIWTAPNGISVGRVDLKRDGQGTRLRSWFPAKQVTGCAPR